MPRFIIPHIENKSAKRVVPFLLQNCAQEDLILTSSSSEIVSSLRNDGYDARLMDEEGNVTAFQGGDTLLLENVPDQGVKRRLIHKHLIDTALAAGVSKIVYASLMGVQDMNLNSTYLEGYAFTESYIAHHNVNFVILRFALKVDDLYNLYLSHVRSHTPISTYAMDGRCAFITTHDYAYALAFAMARDDLY